MALQCGSGLGAAAVHVQRCASWPLAEIVTAHRTDLLVTEFASLDEAEEAWGKLSLLHASVLFVGPKALRSYGRTHSIRRWKERSARLEARLPGEYDVRGATIAGRVVSEIAATDARMRRRLGAGFAAPAWVAHFLARARAVDPCIAACPAVAAATSAKGAARPPMPMPTGDADALRARARRGRCPDARGPRLGDGQGRAGRRRGREPRGRARPSPARVRGLARLEPLRRGPGRALALPVDALDADRLAAALRSGAPRVSVAAATGADGRHRYARSPGQQKGEPESAAAPSAPARRRVPRLAAPKSRSAADLAAYVERLLDAYDGLARARGAVASWLAASRRPTRPTSGPGPGPARARRARARPGRDALLSLCGPDDVARPARRAPSDDDLYRLASECRAVAPPAPRAGAPRRCRRRRATRWRRWASASTAPSAQSGRAAARPGASGRRLPARALATAAVGGGPAPAPGGALETTTAAVGATTEFLADGLFAIGDGLMGLGLGVPGTGRRHRCGSLEAQVDEAKRAAALARGRCSTLEYHVDEAHHMAPLARVPAGAA
ncbi:double-stranded DNA 3'-5' exodeoxyribonuclease [Aureococcus anophagefferens]|uniref:Double-stranded DNA 3'-5' exodeoxyribonuclease n=1 Tax=Aureococcus anophagefferens TaxID=44056 RepID=A0ABR1GAC6_AURAN